MGYRKFTDRDGRSWEIQDNSRSEWMFAPMPGNPEGRPRFPHRVMTTIHSS